LTFIPDFILVGDGVSWLSCILFEKMHSSVRHLNRLALRALKEPHIRDLKFIFPACVTKKQH